MESADRFRAGRDAWPRAVAGGTLALLLVLAAGVAGRVAAAWTRPPARGPDRPPAASRAVPAAREPAPARDIEPIVPPDPTRVLIDLLDLRPGPDPAGTGSPPDRGGRGRPRLIALPAGVRLPALLAADGLPPGVAVAGAPPPETPLPSGMRLVLEAGGGARLEPMPATRRLRLGLPIDLNSASADDLALLPRIGPRLAVRIVEDRGLRGPFASPEALLRVRGVGPTTLEAVRGRVSTVTRGLRDAPRSGSVP